MAGKSPGQIHDGTVRNHFTSELLHKYIPSRTRLSSTGRVNGRDGRVERCMQTLYGEHIGRALPCPLQSTAPTPASLCILLKHFSVQYTSPEIQSWQLF